MSAWMDDDLEERRRRGLYRVRRPLQSGQGTRVRHNGRELINFSSNDYLALAGDPRLARADLPAPLAATDAVPGPQLWYRDTCRRCARWNALSPTGRRPKPALVFSSGYSANLAVVSTLAGQPDAVFSDVRNHASLIDGCRLSPAL